MSRWDGETERKTEKVLLDTWFQNKNYVRLHIQKINHENQCQLFRNYRVSLFLCKIHDAFEITKLKDQDQMLVRNYPY